MSPESNLARSRVGSCRRTTRRRYGSYAKKTSLATAMSPWHNFSNNGSRESRFMIMLLRGRRSSDGLAIRPTREGLVGIQVALAALRAEGGRRGTRDLAANDLQ